MLAGLLRYELSYHLQKKSFWLGAFVFGALGFFFSTTQGRNDGEVVINAPSVLVSQMGILSLGIVFLVAFLANAAFLRDDRYRVAQLVWVTPVRRNTLFLGRISGVFFVASLIFFAAPLGMLVDALISFGGPRKLGPIELHHYVWVYAILSLPTLLFSTAAMSAIAIFSRHQVIVYTAATALYLGYFAAAYLVGSPLMAGVNPASPDVVAWAAILDPFGLSAYFDQVKDWSIVERNSRLFDLDLLMIKNRLLWLGVSMALILLALRWFGPNLKNQRAPAALPDTMSDERPMTYQPVRPQLERAWWVGSFFAMTRLETRFLYWSWPFAGILFLWCVAITPEMLSVLHQSEFSNARYPTTQALLARFQWDMLPFFGTAFLIFLAGESVWREKSDRVDQLLGSTPVKPLQLFASRFFALLLLPLILITSSLLITVIVQLSQGWADFQPGAYLSLYLYGGLPFVAATLITLFCQVIAAGRYSGMALSAALLLGIAGTLGANLGLEHPLFRIASVPGLTSSGMTGFDQSKLIFFSYMTFWLSLGMLLSFVTVRSWPRGMAKGLAMFRANIHSVQKPVLAFVAVAFALVIMSGGWIVWQTNSVSGWQSSAMRSAARADFEHRFARLANLPMPTITAVSTKLDFYPTDHRAQMRGTYQMVNRTDQIIEEILVVLGRGAAASSITMDRAALAAFDPTHRAWVFTLDAPLQPAHSAELTFDIAWQQTGFADLSRSFQLVENGSLIMGPNSFPYVGFPEELRLRGTAPRAQQGLEPLTPMLPIEQALAAAARPLPGNYDKIEFDAILSTAQDEKAIAPGNLVRQWSENDRSYFHYRSNRPITNALFYASARYQCRQDQVEKTALEVCFTDERQANVPVIMAAMKDAILYAETNFGAYHGDVLRAVQVSSLTGLNGYAAPNNLLLGEDSVFEFDQTATSALIDQIYRMVAHETAHQWWGHHLVPARSDEFQGSMVLVETLARYSELMMLEQKYGAAETRKWLDYELLRYFRGRGRDTQPEVPLYKVHGQGYLSYSKGAAAMYAMKTVLGEAVVNQALATLISRFAEMNNPATSLDLLEALYEVSDPLYRPFIDSWFKEITLTDLSVRSVDVLDGPSDGVRVNVSVDASNAVLDGVGNRTETAFTDPLRVHFLDDKGQIIHEVEADFGALGGVISVDLNQRPASIVLDPDYRYLDPDRDNNSVILAAHGR